MKLSFPGWLAAAVALAFLAWMSFVGNLSFQETALGAGCAIFCAMATLLTWSAMELSIAFDLRDVLELWRLPWNVAQDAWIVSCALLCDLLHIAGAGSHLRAVEFELRKGPRGRLREVLAVAYTSVAPNSIVIGIDDRQGLMLIHQIKRNEISQTARRLGARG